jgi:hypothetical protein
MVFGKKKKQQYEEDDDVGDEEEDETGEDEDVEDYAATPQAPVTPRAMQPKPQPQPRQLSKAEVADLIEGNIIRAMHLFDIYKNMP